MPWKETSVYEERMKFVIAWKQGDWTMTDLYAVSEEVIRRILLCREEHKTWGDERNRSTKPYRVINEIACAAIPSTLPVKPSPSVVLPLILIRERLIPSRTDEILSFILSE